MRRYVNTHTYTYRFSHVYVCACMLMVALTCMRTRGPHNTQLRLPNILSYLLADKRFEITTIMWHRQ